jgi:hypothetical protein
MSANSAVTVKARLQARMLRLAPPLHELPRPASLGSIWLLRFLRRPAAARRMATELHAGWILGLALRAELCD